MKHGQTDYMGLGMIDRINGTYCNNAIRVWISIIVSVELQNGYTAHTVHVKVI